MTKSQADAHEAQHSGVPALNVVPFRAPVAMLVTLDADYRYTDVTPEAAAAVGTTPEAILGRRCWDVFPEWEHTPLGSLIRVVMQTQVGGEIRSPAHYQASHDVIARVAPTPDGGVRFAFRFVPHRPATVSRMPAIADAAPPMTGTH